ncbi:MAG: zinc ribbon domain-containing protein [Rhodoferax sp.]|jgi:putative FmdB family regulatory protein|nr:zinc ribbon domain-containing protein [Rhodoferax sp.]
MPIYAYKCSACGFAKDVLQKMSDPVLTECPSCQAAAFSKQLTAAGFQLKGSGWYATDFKGGATAALAVGGAAAAAPEPAAAAEVATQAAPAKSETAPAATPSSGCSTGCACHS